MVLELDVTRMLMSALGVGAQTLDEPTPRAEPMPALDETQAVVEAESVLDPLVTYFHDQQRQVTEALGQALELVDRAQRLAVAPDRRPEVVHQAVPATVAEKARQALAKNPLILDYETTGIRRKPYAYYQNKSPHQAHQVVGVAIMDSAGHILFQSRLDPQRPISAGATRVHGITDDQVAGLPVWDQIAPILRAYLQDRPVVAFNASFDAAFTPDWNIEWLDLKSLADEAFGQWHYSETGDWQKSGSLENRLRQCGLEPGPAHTAAGDCLSALRLLRHLAGYSQAV